MTTFPSSVDAIAWLETQYRSDNQHQVVQFVFGILRAHSVSQLPFGSGRDGSHLSFRLIILVAAIHALSMWSVQQHGSADVHVRHAVKTLLHSADATTQARAEFILKQLESEDGLDDDDEDDFKDVQVPPPKRLKSKWKPQRLNEDQLRVMNVEVLARDFFVQPAFDAAVWSAAMTD
eukprot:TRINITY_DN8997_c0_g1_i2.p2 TRINITY_DN8997_c0_g1~~TRINITY_DN8997_c0_g1_i2.p2  ORF type:complete len:177 (+),score=36.34 TRINITY_DN8997_c0_g1_i2:880-1410(+)